MAQKKLLAKIVDKVFVYDHIVVGISLHKDYGLILDTADLTLSDLVTSVRRKQASAGLEIHTHVQQGKPRGGTGQSGVLSQPFVWAHQFESYQPIVKALLPA